MLVNGHAFFGASGVTRRRVLGAGAGVGAGIVGLLATACGLGQAEQPAAGGTSTLAGTVQHVYWGGDVDRTLQYAMDKFPERVPAAKIELVPIPNGQVQEKLILLVAAGTPQRARSGRSTPYWQADRRGIHLAQLEASRRST